MQGCHSWLCSSVFVCADPSGSVVSILGMISDTGFWSVTSDGVVFSLVMQSSMDLQVLLRLINR
jgi:hypothetical protein